MGTVKPGDRVRITIEGVLQADWGHDMPHRIAAGGASHYLYLHDLSTHGKRNGLTVETLEPEYVEGQAYIDADNDILIRRDGGWLTAYGHEKSDSWAAKPLRRLVPETS